MMIVRRVLICSLVVWSMAASAEIDDVEWSKWGTPTRRTTPSPSDAGVGTSTFRPAASVSTNLTGALTTLLKNFSKLMTADEYSAAKDYGEEWLTNVVRLEILTIAGSDNHFVLPPNANESIEQKQRSMARNIIGIMWLDLYFSERIDAIFLNVTREAVARQYPTTLLTQSEMYKIVENAFDKFEDPIKKDYVLDMSYLINQERAKIQLSKVSSPGKQVYFSFDELKRGNSSEETLVEWSNNVDIRKFLIHKKFLETKNSDGGDAAAVRSILKVAKVPWCVTQMMDIYLRALDESARNFVLADYPSKVMKTFIDTLTRAMEADEEVKKAWAEIKQKMLKKTAKVTE